MEEAGGVLKPRRAGVFRVIFHVLVLPLGTGIAWCVRLWVQSLRFIRVAIISASLRVFGSGSSRQTSASGISGFRQSFRFGSVISAGPWCSSLREFVH